MRHARILPITRFQGLRGFETAGQLHRGSGYSWEDKE
jgi:hypothetical protein